MEYMQFTPAVVCVEITGDLVKIEYKSKCAGNQKSLRS